MNEFNPLYLSAQVLNMMKLGQGLQCQTLLSQYELPPVLGYHLPKLITHEVTVRMSGNCIQFLE